MKSMKKTAIAVVIAVFVFLGLTAPGYADSGDRVLAPSTWVNQRGSTLQIDKIDDDGKLTGTYINRADGFGCKELEYPVTGWVYGVAITFTTKWQNPKDCNSITAWTGSIVKRQTAIDTLWQLVVNNPWKSGTVTAGSDSFSRVEKQQSNPTAE